MGAHQVGAADGDPGAMGYGDPAHLDAVLGTAAYHLGGDDAVGDDPGLAVDILQEPVQGPDALHQPCFELPPLGARKDSGHAVDGNDAFVRLVVPVDGKRDAFVRERARDPVLNVLQLTVGEPSQGVVQRPAVLAGRAVGQEHLVVDRGIEIVGVEVHEDGSSSRGVAAG